MLWAGMLSDKRY